MELLRGNSLNSNSYYKPLIGQEIVNAAKKVEKAKSMKDKKKVIKNFCDRYRSQPLGIALFKSILQEGSIKYPDFKYNVNTKRLIFKIEGV